jgi:hypothetical protein
VDNAKPLGVGWEVCWGFAVGEDLIEFRVEAWEKEKMREF